MFWKYNIGTTHICTLVSEENVTLETLMNEEDILQECKAQNKKLIEFLVRPDIMYKLVSLIVEEPSDGQEDVKYKYPNLACELLTSDVDDITDSMINNPDFLNKLYGFLQQTEVKRLESNKGREEMKECAGDIPNADGSEADNVRNGAGDPEFKQLNPLLASFFSKTINILLGRRSAKMIEFLRHRDDFVNLIAKHIGTSAIMDLWVRLVSCTDDVDVRKQLLDWLTEQRAMLKLIELIDPSIDAESHSNASQAACDIIRVSREYMSQLQEKAPPDPLLDSLESEAMVTELLKHMLRGEKKDQEVIVSGVDVLLTLLYFKKPTFGMGMMSEQHADLNATAQNSSPVCSIPNSQEKLQQNQQINDPNCMTPLDSERLNRSVDQTLSALSSRLPDLHDLLANPPASDPVVLTSGTIDPPFGQTRLQICKLVHELIRINSNKTNLDLKRLQTIDVLVDLFFKYSFNNFLHTQVEQCIGLILRNPPTKPDDSEDDENVLLSLLFEQIHIIQRLVDAWDENTRHESEYPGDRRGYMGHLTVMANHIVDSVENGINGKKIFKFIEDLPGDYTKRWEEFVSGELNEINEKNTVTVVATVTQPPSSSDDSPGFIGMTFPHETALQQVFSDYQMQQMTSNFNDQFGFNEDEFSDHDGGVGIPLDRITGVNFNISADENQKSADMFEQACRQRLQAFDDNGSSDEDIWEDKEQEITFSLSETRRKRTNSESSSDTASTDSDDGERLHLSNTSTSNYSSTNSTPSTGGGPFTPTVISCANDVDITMEVDPADPWTATFDAIPDGSVSTSVAMDTQNVWDAPVDASRSSSNQNDWADFTTFDSDFSCQDPFSSTNNNQSNTAMETSESLPAGSSSSSSNVHPPEEKRDISMTTSSISTSRNITSSLTKTLDNLVSHSQKIQSSHGVSNKTTTKTTSSWFSSDNSASSNEIADKSSLDFIHSSKKDDSSASENVEKMSPESAQNGPA